MKRIKMKWNRDKKSAPNKSTDMLWLLIDPWLITCLCVQVSSPVSINSVIVTRQSQFLPDIARSNISRMHLQQFLDSHLAHSQRTCASPDSLNSSFSSNASSETCDYFQSACEKVNLSFSIENILKPSFGIKVKKTEDLLDLPVDLSRTSNLPSGMIAGPQGSLVPAWVYCTRYSDRPSGGRARNRKRKESSSCQDKKQRTAFTMEQLGRLRMEFQASQYLTVMRRTNLCTELGITENQLKIWFQNNRAKLKKKAGQKGGLAMALHSQGIYQHWQYSSETLLTVINIF